MPQERRSPKTLLERGQGASSRGIQTSPKSGEPRERDGLPPAATHRYGPGSEGRGRGAKGGHGKGRGEEEDDGSPKKELQASPVQTSPGGSAMCQSPLPSTPAPSASQASQSAAFAAKPAAGAGQWSEEERRWLQSMGRDPDEHDDEKGGLEEREIAAALESLIGRLQAEGDPKTLDDRWRDFDEYSNRSRGFTLRRRAAASLRPPTVEQPLEAQSRRPVFCCA